MSLAAARATLSDARFWLVQLCALVIVAGHLAVDLSTQSLPFDFPSSVTVGLILLVTTYAAFNLGPFGAWFTAAWATLLMLPHVFFLDNAAELRADLILPALIDLATVVIADRVSRQRRAESLALSAARAHEASAAHFRAFFQNSVAPTLIVARDGRLTASNPAAGEVFGDQIVDQPLSSMVGTRASADLLEGVPVAPISLTTTSGASRLMRPLCTWIPEPDGREVLQIVLLDITSEHRDRRSSETYAERVLRHQEDERRQLSGTIHDDVL